MRKMFVAFCALALLALPLIKITGQNDNKQLPIYTALP